MTFFIFKERKFTAVSWEKAVEIPKQNKNTTVILESIVMTSLAILINSQSYYDLFGAR